NLIHSLEQMPPYEYPLHRNGKLDSYEAHKFTNNLTSTLFTIDYIEEIIVLFKDEELAFTSKGTVAFDFLFKEKYVNDQYTQVFWNDFMTSDRPLKVFPSSTYRVLYSDHLAYDEKN